MKYISILLLLIGAVFSAYAQRSTSLFQTVVANDGSGDYNTVQAAIDAAPESSKKPWIIFIKNGSYEEQVIISKNKPHIHLIGQDKNKQSMVRTSSPVKSGMELLLNPWQ